jgi:glycosyltransferase involved in cell wall biosynthesis
MIRAPGRIFFGIPDPKENDERDRGRFDDGPEHPFYTRGCPTMPDIVIQRSAAEDDDFVAHLVTRGFRRVVLDLPTTRFMSKGALAIQAIRATIRLILRLRKAGELGTVVALGHFAFMVKLLRKLHIVQYRRSICSGFFVRSPSWFPVFRRLCSIDTEIDHYLIFSLSEIDLYASRLGIDRARMHYLPPGDWRDPAEPIAVPSDSYYFAGGFSNRDYLPVIRAFRKIPARLLIICSALNKELADLELPENVIVMRDVSSDSFEQYLRCARAGIVPLKHDMGASGQTVLLRLMRNAKLAIVSNVGAVRDFVEHNICGYLVDDMESELPGLIALIESAPAASAKMGQAARERYLAHFSKFHLVLALDKILAGGPLSCRAADTRTI